MLRLPLLLRLHGLDWLLVLTLDHAVSGHHLVVRLHQLLTVALQIHIRESQLRFTLAQHEHQLVPCHRLRSVKLGGTEVFFNMLHQFHCFFKPVRLCRFCECLAATELFIRELRQKLRGQIDEDDIVAHVDGIAEGWDSAVGAAPCKVTPAARLEAVGHRFQLAS